MQFTFHATRRTSHGASRSVQADRLLKTRRAPSRHIRDVRVYSHTTTAIHKLRTPPPPPPHTQTHTKTPSPPSPPHLESKHIGQNKLTRPGRDITLLPFKSSMPWLQLLQYMVFKFKLSSPYRPLLSLHPHYRRDLAPRVVSAFIIHVCDLKLLEISPQPLREVRGRTHFTLHATHS